MSHMQKMEAAQAKEDERMGIPPEVRQAKAHAARVQMGMGPGPNATEEEKEEFREMSKNMSANMIGLMWQITKMDIISTLIGICNKILHDHSCSAGTDPPCCCFYILPLAIYATKSFMIILVLQVL